MQPARQSCKITRLGAVLHVQVYKAEQVGPLHVQAQPGRPEVHSWHTGGRQEGAAGRTLGRAGPSGAEAAPPPPLPCRRKPSPKKKPSRATARASHTPGGSAPLTQAMLTAGSPEDTMTCAAAHQPR